MAEYSKKAQDKVEKSMHEMKKGKLKTGSGDKVKSKKQAIAIGLSEAREEGTMVPEKKDSKKEKKSSEKSAKKSTPKKADSKKSTDKKTKKKSAGLSLIHI